MLPSRWMKRKLPPSQTEVLRKTSSSTLVLREGEVTYSMSGTTHLAFFTLTTSCFSWKSV